jgi:hypothetical protein
VPDSCPAQGAPAASDADDLDVADAPRQIQLDDDSPTNGLARLVLTLVKLLHDLLEKQAIRRMEGGRLTEAEVEQVGQTLKRQAEEIEHLCDVFGLETGDLDLPISLNASDLE